MEENLNLKNQKEKEHFKYRLNVPQLFLHPKNFKADIVDLLGKSQDPHVDIIAVENNILNLILSYLNNLSHSNKSPNGLTLPINQK